MATATLTVDKQHDQQVLDAFRRWGYLQADLDPLGRLEPAPHPDLDELEGDAAEAGRRHYSGTIGVEFMHIADPDRRRWVAERMEGPAPEVDHASVFDRLVRAG
jgi:2-oxoglutarate dehydrogenase E1 component